MSSAQQHTFLEKKAVPKKPLEEVALNLLIDAILRTKGINLDKSRQWAWTIYQHYLTELKQP